MQISLCRAPLVIICHFGCWHKRLNLRIGYTSRTIYSFTMWTTAPQNNHSASATQFLLRKPLRRHFRPSKLTHVLHMSPKSSCGVAGLFFSMLRRCGRPLVGGVSPACDNIYMYIYIWGYAKLMRSPTELAGRLKIQCPCYYKTTLTYNTRISQNRKHLNEKNKTK